MPSHFSSLPVIDISGLYAEEPEARLAVARKIGAASRNVGFFYVTGHRIGRELRERLLDTAKRFFALPDSEKMEFYIGRSRNHTGYVPPGEEVFYGQKPDRKEAYDVNIDIPADDPEVASGAVPMLGPVQWPADPGFRRAVGAYYDEVAAWHERCSAVLRLPSTCRRISSRLTSRGRRASSGSFTILSPRTRLSMSPASARIPTMSASPCCFPRRRGWR